MLQQPSTASNPQAFMMLQSHVQQHVAMHARDLVQEMFNGVIQEAQARGEMIPQVDPAALKLRLHNRLLIPQRSWHRY